MFAVVTDRASGGIDPCDEGRIGDDTTTPDGGDKIVLADHTLPIADQVLQQVKHLRRKRNRAPRRGLARAGPCRAHSPQKGSASRRSISRIDHRNQPSTAGEVTIQDNGKENVRRQSCAPGAALAHSSSSSDFAGANAMNLPRRQFLHSRSSGRRVPACRHVWRGRKPIPRGQCVGSCRGQRGGRQTSARA